jgi:hypothetical protein
MINITSEQKITAIRTIITSNYQNSISDIVENVVLTTNYIKFAF